jgi:hypothetical protein
MKKSFLLFTLLAFLFQSCFVSNTTKLKSHKPIFGKVKTHENEIENSGQVSQEQIIRSEVKAETLTQLSYENTEITDLATTENEIIDIPKQKNNVFDGGCDKITFLNGNEEEVKLMEIGDDFVKYKKCNNLDGPIYSTSKEKLFMITFSNGSKEVIDHKNDKPKIEEKNSNTYNNQQTNGASNPEVNGLAIASFVFGLLGFIPLAGLILGIIANKQITKEPNRYKGSGFATAGILLSIFWLVLLFVILAL